jgi:peptidoglycan hydrolase-like protein with peptidoglycan-binding domain
VRLRRAAGLALPAIGVVAAGAVVIAGAGGGSGDGPRAAAPSSGRTVAVARRTLVDRQRVDGTLGYAGSRSVSNRLSGTVTWLPHVGQVIQPGQVLLRVNGKPVVLMNGTLPAYRTLKAGIEKGADVTQLERGLSALGYSPGTIDDSYTTSTAAAVRAWQGDLGVAKTGKVELGRVAFLPGARRVTDVKSSLGSAASNPSGGSDLDTQLISYSPVKDTPSTPNGASGPSGPTGGNGGNSGGGGDSDATADANAPASEVLVTSSTRRVVTAKVDAADQQLAARGRRVRVELPDGRIISGRITNVGTVAAADQNSGDGGGGGGDTTAKITITIRLRSARAAGRIDQAPVSVQLARTTRRKVLAVPVQALVAQRGNRYAVERADGRLVSVVPGMFADGYVELTGGRIRAGDRVRVPQ